MDFLAGQPSNPMGRGEPGVRGPEGKPGFSSRFGFTIIGSRRGIR